FEIFVFLITVAQLTYILGNGFLATCTFALSFRTGTGEVTIFSKRNNYTCINNITEIIITVYSWANRFMLIVAGNFVIIVISRKPNIPVQIILVIKLILGQKSIAYSAMVKSHLGDQSNSRHFSCTKLYNSIIPILSFSSLFDSASIVSSSLNLLLVSGFVDLLITPSLVKPMTHPPLRTYKKE
ncbi:hypothetical protein ACHAXS_010861, partial [Conticribra weissflogii]